MPAEPPANPTNVGAAAAFLLARHESDEYVLPVAHSNAERG